MITRRRFLGGGFASLLAVEYSELFSKAENDITINQGQDGASLHDLIAARRTVRNFAPRPLTNAQLMDLLWAAQGITDNGRGYRAVPSAGALYPLEIYPFLGDQAVGDMRKGVYRYRSRQSDLVKTVAEDLRQELARACLSQMWVAKAPVCLLISAVHERTTSKYGKRGVRYAAIEAGCSAQNVFLMAVSLGLAAGIVGAFQDDNVGQLTGAGKESTPLLVMPVGYRA